MSVETVVEEPAPEPPTPASSMLPPDPFTAQDAQNILTVVRRAPLQNYDESLILGASMQRFVAFVQANVK